MATDYKAGCCAECKRPIRNAYKWEPIFYISDGPVYLHPKCEAKFNGTEEEPSESPQPAAD